MIAKKVLLEANGGLTAQYMVQAAIAANIEPVGSDIHSDTICSALGYESIILPSASDPSLWEIIRSSILEHEITDVV